MTFKALAIDLDGTLLIGEDLSQEKRTAVHAAHDAGLEIIIATARWRQMAERIAAEIGIQKPIIACSGAQVYLPDSQQDIFNHRIPHDVLSEIYAVCNDQRCIATISLDKDIVIKLDGKPASGVLPSDLIWVPKLDVASHPQARIAAIQGSKIVDFIKSEIYPKHQDKINLYDSIGPSGKIVITITAKKASKGEALLVCCEHLGIDPLSVVAYGDAENDIEMFKVSGASVAMGQADQFVKDAATTVTASNEEHGVAQSIMKLLQTGQP